MRVFAAAAFWAIIIVGSLGQIASLYADDWPQWLGADRLGEWREDRLIQKFPTGGPRVLWRQPIGPGYSGPAVAAGRVYVMERERELGPDGKPVTATRQVGSPGKERVLCLDVSSGKILWKYDYPAIYKISYGSGPRTTPMVHDGRVYTLGAMGRFCCLDAVTGMLVWECDFLQKYTPEPPIWGWAAHPLMDGNLIYSLVGGDGSAVVAFHKDTGKEVWRALSSQEVCYSSPVIVEAGGKRQLIVWLSESINSVDPATGKVYWSMAYPASGQPQRPAVNICHVRSHKNRLFFTNAYHGGTMLELREDKPGARVLWQEKSVRLDDKLGLHSLMPAPVLRENEVFGNTATGELCCLDATDGKRIWQTFQPIAGKKTDCGTAFIIPQGDRFILFNDQGELILANLSARGYQELDRARILEPVEAARGRKVVWSHPAFANRCVFARNNQEIVCINMAAEDVGK